MKVQSRFLTKCKVRTLKIDACTICQSNRVSLKLGHSDKHFLYNTRKEGSTRINFGIILLEKLKNCILIKKLNPQIDFFHKKSGHFFSVFEKQQGRQCFGELQSKFFLKDTIMRVFYDMFLKYILFVKLQQPFTDVLF